MDLRIVILAIGLLGWLSVSCSEDASVMYENFRGHQPEPEALMKKLGLSD